MRKDIQLKMFVFPGLLLALILAVMRWYGDANDLFVQNLWYDKVMHAIGGLGACALAFWGIANLDEDRKWSILRFGLPIVGLVSAMILGAGWELLEVIFPVITNFAPQSRWDTAFDVLFDGLGGLIAGVHYRRRWRWQ
jgi:hypothetical protein